MKYLIIAFILTINNFTNVPLNNVYVSRKDSEVKEKILVTFNAEISNDNDKLENILKSRGFLDYKLISSGEKRCVLYSN